MQRKSIRLSHAVEGAIVIAATASLLFGGGIAGALGSHSAPVGCGSAPVGSSSAPVGNYSGPVGWYSAPVGNHSAPVGSHSAPVGSHSAPVQCASAPVGSHSAPVGSHSAPVGGHSAPVPSTTTTTRPAPTTSTTSKPTTTTTVKPTTTTTTRPAPTTTTTAKPTPPVSFQHGLWVSNNKQRKNSSALTGQRLDGNVYIFDSAPASSVAKVNFYLDGRQVRVETIKPYDLNATDDKGNAYALNVNGLGRGSHTVKALITTKDGKYVTDSGTFTVR